MISDEEFFDAVSDEEKEYYKENAPDPDSVEGMNIHCTACGDQVPTYFLVFVTKKVKV